MPIYEYPEDAKEITYTTKKICDTYDIVRKRKLKEGEKIIGVATALSGKKYNLVRSGKLNLTK